VSVAFWLSVNQVNLPRSPFLRPPFSARVALVIPDLTLRLHGRENHSARTSRCVISQVVEGGVARILRDMHQFSCFPTSKSHPSIGVDLKQTTSHKWSSRPVTVLYWKAFQR
jgi:hypothetical protein